MVITWNICEFHCKEVNIGGIKNGRFYKGRAYLRSLIFAALYPLKHLACFARATQVWLAVNYNTSVTSGELIRCSKHSVAFNQSYVFYEAMNGCKNLKVHKRLALNMYM